MIIENGNTTPKDVIGGSEQQTQGMSNRNNNNNSNINVPKTLTNIKTEQQDVDNEEGDFESSQDKHTMNDIIDDDGQPLTKRPKIEFADAESNTLQTGKYMFIYLFFLQIFFVFASLFNQKKKKRGKKRLSSK